MPAPILEFDDSGDEAIIEPKRVLKPLDTMPEYCIYCFFAEVIKTIAEQAEVVIQLGSEIGRNPVYSFEAEDHTGQKKQVAMVHPGVGAPLAGGFLEETIALGASKFIACGGAGVLNREIAMGHLVVPVTAVREEGTSYHYLPADAVAAASNEAVAAIEATLNRHEIPYVLGKTWTTDGIYRETPRKIAKRRSEGCLTVEMETSAFFAIAQYRNVSFAQILYGGDDVSGEVWDNRDWQKAKSTRERLFWLAVEAVLRL